MADDDEEKKKSDDDDSGGSNKSSSGKDQGSPKDSGPNNDTQDQGGDQGGPQFSEEAQQGRREEGGGKSSSGKDRGESKDSGPNNEPQDQGGPQFSPEAQQQGGQDGGDPYGYESSSNDPGGFYRNPPPGVGNDPYGYESSSNDPSSFYRDPGSQYGAYQGPPQNTGDEQRLEQELQQAYQGYRQQAPPENLAPESDVRQYSYKVYNPIADMVRGGTRDFGYQPGYDPATGQTTEITQPASPSVAPLRNGPLTTQAGVPGGDLQNGPLTTQAGVPGGPLQNGPLVATPAPAPSTAVPAPAAPAPATPGATTGPAVSPEAAAAGAAPVAGAAVPVPVPTAEGAIPAYKGPTDQQTLAGQSPGSQGAFKDVYGQNADKAWQLEHGEELKNIALYGAAKPPPNAPASPTAPAGIPPYRGPDPAVTTMLNTFRVTPPVPAAGPGAPARPGAPVVPTPQTGAAAASAVAPGAAPVTPGSPVLPTTGTPGAPVAGGVVGMAQAADGREVPIVDSLIGKVVNQQPLDAVTLAAGQAKADGTPIEGARDQIATEIANETERGDRFLTPIAQIAWYKENLVRDASFRQPPEQAPAEYVASWKGMWKAGKIAPMTTALAAGLLDAGEKPPWVTRPERTLAANNQKVNDAIRGVPAPGETDTRPAGATPAGATPRGIIPIPLKPAPITPQERADAIAARSDAGRYGIGQVNESLGRESATYGIGQVNEDRDGSPADAPRYGIGQVNESRPAPPVAAAPGPDTRPLTADEENRIIAARPPIPQAPVASTGPVAATVPAASAAPGGLITQAAPTPGGVLEPTQPRRQAIANAPPNLATPNRGETAVANAGPVGAPPANLNPLPPAQAPAGATIPPAATASDAERYGTGQVNTNIWGPQLRGVPSPTADSADIASVQGTPSSRDVPRNADRDYPPTPANLVAPADISSVQGTPSSADRYQTGEEVIPPRVPTSVGDISVQPTPSAADQPTTGEGAIPPQVPDQYDPLTIRTSDTAGLAQRMLDQMDASVANQALPGSGRETAGQATNLVPSANPSLISTAAQKRDTVLGITASTLDAQQQGRTEVQQTSPEYERTLATAMAKLSLDPNDAGAQWAKPALDQVARLAWSRQSGQSPEEAPQSYVESWKDNFRAGADIPLVNELSDDMRRAGVVPPGAMPSATAWQARWTPEQMAINQEAYIDAPYRGRALTKAEAYAICGVVSAASLARVYGKDVSSAPDMMALLDDAAKNNDWNLGSGLQGQSAGEIRILARMGIDARIAPGWQPALVQSEVAAGRPVSVNTGGSEGHIWTVTAYNPQTGMYTVGGSGDAIRKGMTQVNERTLTSMMGSVNSIVYLDPADIAAKTGPPGKVSPPAPPQVASFNPDTLDQNRTPMMASGPGGVGRSAVTMNALMGSKYGTNVQQELVGGATPPAPKPPWEQSKEQIDRLAAAVPSADPLPDKWEDTNPRPGLISGVDDPRDQVAKTWQDAYKLSGGDKDFADAVGGLVTREEGYYGGGDKKGGVTAVVGLYQFTNPNGDPGMKDFYNRWLQKKYPDLASPTDKNNWMSKYDQVALDKAAKDVDKVNEFYLPRLYKGWQQLKATQKVIPPDQAPGLLAKRATWKETEEDREVGYDKQHNGGASTSEYDTDARTYFRNGKVKPKSTP